MGRGKETEIFLRARLLRRNPTKAELMLWSRLRAHRLNGVGFRRQLPIGQYIVDFCAPRRKIIIELDGNPHIDQREYDSARTAFLQSRGFTVIRFWNDKVITSMEGVLNSIREALNSSAQE